jgi:hypothetical protein
MQGRKLNDVSPLGEVVSRARDQRGGELLQRFPPPQSERARIIKLVFGAPDGSAGTLIWETGEPVRFEETIAPDPTGRMALGIRVIASVVRLVAEEVTGQRRGRPRRGPAPAARRRPGLPR